MCACGYFIKDKLAEEQISGRGKASDKSDIHHNDTEWISNLNTLYKSIFVIPCRDDAAVYLGKAMLSGAQHSFSPHIT